jgi:signal transduction histidine kinase
MNRISIRILAGVVWLTLSLSLGIWWSVMGFRYANDIANLQKELGLQSQDKVVQDLHRKQRMIKMEGIFFLLLISGGGLTLIFMSIRDENRNKILKDFFATVTHEMKTPLASLRLQAESLAESIKAKKHQKLIRRLVLDTERLELQMEKALYLASLSRAESLFMEKFQLSEILNPMQNYYPQLDWNAQENVELYCDKRALESILKNLIENSMNHGQASKIYLRVRKSINTIFLEITDNGIGFRGNLSKLGQLYYKHTNRSGSGIGLFLTKALMQKMHGKANFYCTNSKFQVELEFPKLDRMQI